MGNNFPIRIHRHCNVYEVQCAEIESAASITSIIGNFSF